MRASMQIGDFELDVEAYQLRRSGEPVKIERIPMELLLLLARNRGKLVTREQVAAHIWGADHYIDSESAINTAVRKLRKVLEAGVDGVQWIETVPAKGYRLMAEDRAVLAADGSPSDGSGLSEASVELAEVEGDLGVAIAETPPSFDKTPSLWRYLKWRWLASVGILILVVGGGVLILRERDRARSVAAPPRVMLAVLPFVNLSGDPAQDYFVDGMTEEMITQFGGMSPRTLGVIARTSAMQFKNSGESIAQIARELGVDYVIEGSVRRSGDRIRVTAQLIQARDQTHLWARDYDRNVSDVIEIQGAISSAVAREVRAALPAPGTNASRDANGDPPMEEAAHDAYLRGLQEFNQRSKPALASAISEFRQAVSIDPNSAIAWAALARAYSLAPVFTILPSAEALPQARDAATRALRLDDTSAVAHCTLGFVLAHYDFDWPNAEREYKRAIELNPSDANSHFFYSNSFLSPQGRHDEALAEMRTAISLDPLSFPIQSYMGRTLLWAHRYDEALAQFVKANTMNPNSAIGHERIAHLYAAWEKYGEAISEEENARILAGESPEAGVAKAQQLRTALEQRGPRGYWEQELVFAAAPENPPEFLTGSFGHAVLYAQLGEEKEANAALEQAIAEHDLRLTEIGVEPLLQPIRGNDEFARLERRVRLTATKLE